MLRSDLAGLAQPDDSRCVFGTGTTSALLVTAAQQRTVAHAATQVEDTDPLRRMQLSYNFV